MRVEDRIRRNAVFIGIWNPEPNFVSKAARFIASVQTKHGALLYLVTAEHVISGLMAAGHEKIVMRFNNSQGGVSFGESSPRAWFFHPETERSPTDVAVVPIGITQDIEWLSADTNIFLSEDKMKALEYGVGDEVVVVGMFRAHTGKRRNIPLVRIGSLAALPEEPVYTKYTGDMEAYLVEMHSIGGLSGSPVYIH